MQLLGYDRGDPVKVARKGFNGEVQDWFGTFYGRCYDSDGVIMVRSLLGTFTRVRVSKVSHAVVGEFEAFKVRLLESRRTGAGC